MNSINDRKMIGVERRVQWGKWDMKLI